MEVFVPTLHLCLTLIWISFVDNFTVNNIHEKMSQFWLAESSTVLRNSAKKKEIQCNFNNCLVKIHCFTSVFLTHVFPLLKYWELTEYYFTRDASVLLSFTWFCHVLHVINSMISRASLEKPALIWGLVHVFFFPNCTRNNCITYIYRRCFVIDSI